MPNKDNYLDAHLGTIHTTEAVFWGRHEPDVCLKYEISRPITLRLYQKLDIEKSLAQSMIFLLHPKRHSKIPTTT